MTREEQLVFCKKCINRRLDSKQGFLCALTGEKADFEKECAHFQADPNVDVALFPEEEVLTRKEIKAKLPVEVMEKLRLEQRLFSALLTGLIVGVIGAILWGIISVATGYQIGYMALAIGAAVGLSIRLVGRGLDNVFGFMGAGIAFFSVLLGNFFTIIGFLANTFELGYWEMLGNINYQYLPDLMIETFSPFDLLFYGIAVYEGYRFSFRVISSQPIIANPKS